MINGIIKLARDVGASEQMTKALGGALMKKILPENIGVYCIQNKVNGKRYIGSSSNISDRWKRHVSKLAKNNHHSVHLQRAWNKHGAKVFEFFIIEICEPSLLIATEQRYIDVMKPEYNISLTAGSTTGVIRTDAYRQKQSISQSGKVLSDETRKKISEGMKGKRNSLGVARVQTEETKKKISAKLTGTKRSEETRAKIRAKNITYRHTDEAKEKIRQAGLGRVVSKETIEKRRATRARNKQLRDERA